MAKYNGTWMEHKDEVSDKIQNLDTDGNFTPDAVAAEHGPGAISTAGAPTTYRWKENGTIIKEIKFDLTGFKSINAGNDVIGLDGTDGAYIGRYVVATDGIIYKAELICLELPTTGDDDVNVVELAASDGAYNDAGGTDYVVNGGVAAKGQVIENTTPALTAGEYWYLTAGAGDTAGTYAAGQFILRTYGHAAL